MAHLCHRIVVRHDLVPQLAIGLPASPRLPRRPGLSGPLAGAARRRSAHSIKLFSIAPELSHLCPQILVLTELLRVRPSACSTAERVHGTQSLLQEDGYVSICLCCSSRKGHSYLLLVGLQHSLTLPQTLHCGIPLV